MVNFERLVKLIRKKLGMFKHLADLLFKDHDKEKFKIDELNGKPVPRAKCHLVVKQFNELKSIVSGSANKDGEVCTEMLSSFVQ